MYGSKKLFLPLMAAAVLMGCGDKNDSAATEDKPAPTQVAAKVNGNELTVHQVNFALERIPNLNPDRAQEASLQVVRNLVDQEVLAQQAMTDNLDRDPKVVQALDASRRQILAEAYMTKKLGTPSEPTDAEIAAYYDARPELFAKRKIYRLQEIAIKAAPEKHEAIRAQLTASKTLNDFAAWLKQEGFEVKAGQGVKPAEQLPLDLLPKLAQMPDGQAIVVNSPEGLLVIVLADSQTQPATLEQAKPAIKNAMMTESRQKAARAELAALKSKAKIEYVGEFADAGKETPPPAAAQPAASEKPAAPATAPSATDGAAPEPASPAEADADAISKGISGLK